MKVFIARRVNRLLWAFPRRSAARFYDFALAEHGSMLDLKLAARRCGSAERAALYLRHAHDEARHARVFAKQANRLRKELGQVSYPPPASDTEALFECLGEVDFVAFVHRGERRGRALFEAHRDHFARASPTTAKLFEGVLVDERRHESYTAELLVALSGSERHARQAIRRVGRWEAWRSFRRMGRPLGDLVYTLTMWAVYLGCLPLVLPLRMLRPVRAGFRSER